MNITKLLPLLFCSMLSLSLQPTDEGVCGAGSSAGGSASASVFELAEGDKYPEVKYGSDERQAILYANTTTLLEKFLQSIENLNFTFAGGRTPLMYACELGQIEMVKALLANEKVNISCYSTSMGTALSLAATYFQTSFFCEDEKTTLYSTECTKINTRIEIINLLLDRPDLKVHSDHDSSEKIKMFLRSIVSNDEWSLEERLQLVSGFLHFKVLFVADLLFPLLELRPLAVEGLFGNSKEQTESRIMMVRSKVEEILAEKQTTDEQDADFKKTFDLDDGLLSSIQKLRPHVCWSPLRKEWVHAVAVPSAALQPVPVLRWILLPDKFNE